MAAIETDLSLSKCVPEPGAIPKISSARPGSAHSYRIRARAPDRGRIGPGRRSWRGGSQAPDRLRRIKAQLPEAAGGVQAWAGSSWGILLLCAVMVNRIYCCVLTDLAFAWYDSRVTRDRGDFAAPS